ncbi:hypothetical protein WQ54_21365 [Bacillus sp. SA1-12]|uniref:hypothetical protein n=1 Tax=Bacillus sp. SA1-12 TaxID=1455638 RepID=UPI00062705C2|nr:hypothetical protein [Bacillus sp. SA1-12]KKI90496.1 hypothetical protein WQ54_21365 [Bacillus sp. SA1-12]
MIIAMVLGEKETIVPIIEGKVIRLYDVKSGDVQDFENPALKVDTGKRGAVIKWLNERGVHILCSPPSMLCELSYETAKQANFRYYRVQKNTPFFSVKQELASNQLELTEALPKNEIEPSLIPKVSK